VTTPPSGCATPTQSIFSAAAGAERIVELLDQEPSVRESPTARPLRRPRGHVAVEDVSFTYPEATRPALRDVSLTIRAGEVIALVGPSGAGKSTFASLLLRLADPQLGVVRLDGHDVRELTLDSVRSAVGVLLQDAPILDASARDNIAYGAGDVDDAAVIAAVRQQTRMPSSPRCRMATIPCSANAERVSRGASASGSRLHGPCSVILRSSFWMRPPLPWIPSRKDSFRRRWIDCCAGGPSS